MVITWRTNNVNIERASPSETLFIIILLYERETQLPYGIHHNKSISILRNISFSGKRGHLRYQVKTVTALWSDGLGL